MKYLNNKKNNYLFIQSNNKKLRKYLNRWRNVVKNDKPLLEELFKKIKHIK